MCDTQYVPKRLAEKLLRIREALGWSHREMARRLTERSGTIITYVDISGYERGTSVPYLEIVLAYARFARIRAEEILDDDLEMNLQALFAAGLILPNVYDPDALSSVKWLQAHLPLSDEYLARLIGVGPTRFSNWKRGAQALTTLQTETLENLSELIKRFVSYFNFRRDLMMRALEFRSDRDQFQGDSFAPPWLGTSLKDYLLAHGAKGIAEVHSWIEKLKSANSLRDDNDRIRLL